MGLVTTSAEIELQLDQLREIVFLVDTGSLFTFIPPALAAELGISFTVTSRVVLADNRTAEVPVGVAGQSHIKISISSIANKCRHYDAYAL